MTVDTSPEAASSSTRREVGSPQWCARLLRTTMDDSLQCITDVLTVAGDGRPGAPGTVLTSTCTLESTRSSWARSCFRARSTWNALSGPLLTS